MTLDKAIEYKKEHRKQYYGSKAVDPTCRNHGSDDWSVGNRLYKNKKRQASIDEQIEEIEEWFDNDYSEYTAKQKRL